eukprot:CFRG5201T1
MYIKNALQNPVLRVSLAVNLLAMGLMMYLLVNGSVGTTNIPQLSEVVKQDRECTKTKEYFPSPWEMFWVNNMSDLQESTREWKKGCAAMKEKAPFVEEWVKYAKANLNANSLSESGEWSKEVFSYFKTTVRCEGEDPVVEEEPIEPLVGFLRHPMFLCFSGNFRVDKDYLIPSFISSWGSGRNFYFDAGASTYLSGAGGASQGWFVEEYRTHGIEFEHIWGWEAKGEQKSLLRETPKDIVAKTSFFAIPVSAEVDHMHNPIRFIKQNCKEEDFVVFKLDIDTPVVETPLARQLLDPEVAKLIDEYYFEDHVSGNPMEHYGWTTSEKDHDLANSIEYFYKLRKLGIRAHSWV